MKLTKQMILAELPANYTVSVSHTGLIVTINHILDNDLDVDNALDVADKAVHSMARKFKLRWIDSGTDFYTNMRDWTFISKPLEKDMLAESKDLLKCMKAFFKKWGNTYCESTKTYEVIDTMRAMIASDEN